MKLFPSAAGRFRLTLSLLGSLLALAPWARAQERIGVNAPFLVKDINTMASERLSSNPRNYVVIGSVAYFTATDPALGTELWRSDGTAAGTWMVKDINPGAGSSSPSYLAKVGGMLYFFANDGIHGTEPWKSNGTAAGTTLVKDIMPGEESSYPNFGDFVSYGGKVYFIAGNGQSPSHQLWKTDGTPAGTVKVTGPASEAIGNNCTYMTVRGGKLYFLDVNGSGYMLCQTDGTSAGTVAIKRFGTERPLMLKNVSETLYMVTHKELNYILWKSNGTAAGTVAVKQLPRSSDPSFLSSTMTGLNGKLYFLLENTSTPEFTKELWQSDGTTAGTRLIKSFTWNYPDFYPYNLVSSNGALYFLAYTAATGAEPWRSDGTAAGTRILKDIVAGTTGSMPRNIVSAGGKVWFTITNLGAKGSYFNQLWQTDGTAAGTHAATPSTLYFDQSLSIPSGSGVKDAPVTANGTYFFSALDGHGYEPWKTNGTPAGTAMVKDLAIGSDSNPGLLTAAGGTLFFAANDTVHGYELWKSNVTAATTQMLKDIQLGWNSGFYPAMPWPYYPESKSSVLAYLGGVTWFIANDSINPIRVATRGLWRSDGTPAGTRLVKNGFNSLAIAGTTGGKIILLNNYDSAANGLTLWQTSPSATGMTMLKSFGASSSGSYAARAANGWLFFTVSNNNQSGLWKTNGTVSGTVRVSTVTPEDRLVAAGNKVYFVAHDAGYLYGYELWVSDGTPAGTKMVKDIVPNTGSRYYNVVISNLTAVGEILYFTINDGTHGQELWRTNGTAAGTYLVKDIYPGATSANPQNLTVIGNTVYFSANDGAHGPELWKTNGTAAGTVMVRDLNPGAGGSNPSNLANIYGTLYFNAYHPTFGNELWRSNGTAAGTWLVSDIVPGIKGSNPTNLTLVNSFLYFVAADYRTLQGRELWAVRVR